jgi:hypothetical protein
VMVASLVETARYYNSMNEVDFFTRFGEVNRILDSLDGPISVAAEEIYNLHKRYGLEVETVLSEYVRLNSRAIARGEISQNSLLAMVVGPQKKKAAEMVRMQTFPTPPGTTWKDITIEVISKESARILAKGINKIYVAAEMGFVDRRKGDLPNKQWELLLILAENGGRLTWGSRQQKRTVYKTVQNLKAALRRFFGLTGDPIKSYQKEAGYVANFRMADHRGSR